MVVTVKRGLAGAIEQLPIELPPRPLKRLGLVMEIGPIEAVQAESPAAVAGLAAGDLLEKIDGQPVGDPEMLAGRLDRMAGKTVAVVVGRKGEILEKSVTLREPYAFERSLAEQEPKEISSMGIAYQITNHVVQVIPDSPAAKAGIRPGATVISAELVPPSRPAPVGDEIVQQSITIKFAADKPNWACFYDALQSTLPGTTVKLTLADDAEFELEPAAVADEWYPDRGFRFTELLVMHRATSFSNALSLGATEAVESVTQVYRFLRKIGTQISPKGMSGPPGILKAAYGSASRGLSDLLIFLGMLSANLAVLNFLPIPLLDGGHMVFLILEGVRGKPVSERVVIAFHYAGFLFIISLMVFVFALDLHWIPRTP
jgi:regulator of sigma E protease